MGCGRHAYKGGSLYSNKDNLPCRQTRSTLCIQDCQSAWGTQDYHFRPRIFVYLGILAMSTPSLGNRLEAQHRLSPADRWTDRASKSNLGRYASSMRSRTRTQMGRQPVVH